MKFNLKVIADALNLTDGNKLSITNTMMFVLIGKVTLSPNIDWSTVSSLFLACAVYSHKRHVKKKQEAAVKVADNDVEKIKESVKVVLDTAKQMQEQATAEIKELKNSLAVKSGFGR